MNQNVHSYKDDPYKRTQRWWERNGRQEMAGYQFGGAQVTPQGSQTPAAAEPYQRNPKLANVKWSDNELRAHIKDNLKDLGKKYDQSKYEAMARKELEEAYAKIHAQKEKQEKQEKYGNLSRNELEKAIARELGHPLDKKYQDWSENELRQELARLKESPQNQGNVSSAQSYSKPIGSANSPYADNCVLYLRNVEKINLPPSLLDWASKKKIINSSTPKEGSAAIIRIDSGPYKNIGHVAKVIDVDLSGSTKSITLREANYPRPGIYERQITGKTLEEIQAKAHIEGYYRP